MNPTRLCTGYQSKSIWLHSRDRPAWLPQGLFGCKATRFHSENCKAGDPESLFAHRRGQHILDRAERLAHHMPHQYLHTGHIIALWRWYGAVIAKRKPEKIQRCQFPERRGEGRGNFLKRHRQVRYFEHYNNPHSNGSSHHLTFSDCKATSAGISYTSSGIRGDNHADIGHVWPLNAATPAWLV